MTPAPDESTGPDGHLSTAQAARLLGVKPETLYAYVSRGALTRVTVPGRRGSWFPVTAVEALRQNGSRGRRAGLSDRVQTAVTLIADDQLYYRGRAVTDLATRARFTEVCALLWQVDDVTLPVVATALPLPDDGGALRPVDVIRTALSVDAARREVRGDLRPEAVVATAAGCLATAIGALPLLGRPPGRELLRADPVAAQLWPRLTARRATRAGVDLLRAALVLLADHELAASTTAARVAASARADLHGVLLAALGAMDSPLHGTAPAAARRMLRRAITDPAAVVTEHLATGARPPGFGHLVYRDGDPRAEHLLAALAQLPGADPRVTAAVSALRSEFADRREWFPTVDLALAALGEALDLVEPAGEAVFTLARLAGWTAHALEEYQEEPMRFRLTGVYVGRRPDDR